jgi:hypothetical protein
MAIKRTPITEEQFKLIHTTVDWNIDEVPQENWEKILGLQRLDATFAIMASGTISDPRTLNNIEAIAGMDVLVGEENPKIEKGEGEGNAYHYVFQKTNDVRYPYIMHGPFKSETRIDHWFDADDLNAYWSDDVT